MVPLTGALDPLTPPASKATLYIEYGRGTVVGQSEGGSQPIESVASHP